MGKHRQAPWRWWRAAAVVGLSGLVAACAGEQQTAAPVILKGGAPEMAAGALPPTAMPPHRMQRIVVRPGQSLGRIAQDYRVSERAIIAANHLKPPYKVEAGQRLLIPGATAPLIATASAAAPLPAAAPPPPVQAGRPLPGIIPLDGPAPPKASAALPAGSPAKTARAEPSAAEEARAEAAPSAAVGGVASPRGGHMPWPVQGRVLAGYGAASGGAHNDGINIAAPRGAPVHAVDSGTVAYAGNELRGYGNLVLVKHANGMITAYAHCEELLVKQGEPVKRGQVIAKVGATGGVAEPQLHFETRRGKRAVDPRELLGPAPSAESAARSPAG